MVIAGNNRYRLENDATCGLPTGGQGECWWTCTIEVAEYSLDLGSYANFITNPSCLTSCYPADHCLTSVLEDYKSAQGICRGSFLDVAFPGLFPVSDQPCELYNPEECDCTLEDYYNNFCTEEETVAANCWWWEKVNNAYDVRRGLCSEKTQELLQHQDNCIIPSFSQNSVIFYTTLTLVRSLCDWRTWVDFNPASGSTVNTNRFTQKKEDYDARLNPIEAVAPYPNNVTITLIPPLENTKHRYPWICSLRSVGQQSSHICGVTLLSRPPGPTVLVTSAHCVYICKSEEGRLVPNCCCPNVGPSLCTETQDCGTNATTVEMTGTDVEVLCGEWDTATDTQEEYNVILPIEKITVHPKFNISRGELNSQFVADDIATLHVSDDNFEAQSRTNNIYPACLPISPTMSNIAIHSGWSKPPPFEFITNTVPLYEEVYGEFFKQWHYHMNITQCKDPVTHFWTGASLKHPTDSYYPPGTVCAVEKEREFCPTSGESGSPLMVTDNRGRFVAIGIHSFIKERF